MEKTASQIQKERTKELEDKANALLAKCSTAALTSINEKGYPRTCILNIAKQEGFSDLYFVTSKRSPISGKAVHIESYRKSKDNGSFLAVSGRFVLRQITRHNAAFQTYRPEATCKAQRSNQPALFCFLRRFLLECKNSGKKKS